MLLCKYLIGLDSNYMPVLLKRCGELRELSTNEKIQ